MITKRIFTLFIAASLLGSAVAPFTVLANDQVPTGTITIEQQSALGNTAVWTLVNQDQTVFKGNAATQQVKIPAGNYTFFIEQTKGLSAEVHYQSGSTIKTYTIPQFSFQYDGIAPIKISVSLLMKDSGKVSVNSSPQGIDFELKGPSGFVYKGTTPTTYEAVPLGVYSIRYMPTGCDSPVKSGSLKPYSRLDFDITISCSTLTTKRTAENNIEGLLTVKMNGKDVILRDVPSTAWFATYVQSAAERGYVTGYTNADGNPLGMFGPSDPVTLAQLAKIVHAVGGVNEKEMVNPPANFSTPSWASRYIASAEQRDWRVFIDPTINLNRPATRGEVLVTLLQVMNVPLRWPSGTLFGDVTRRAPYASAIETAAKDGIVAGLTDANGKATGNFGPLDPVNRAEMSKIIMKVIEIYGKTTHAGTGAVKL